MIYKLTKFVWNYLPDTRLDGFENGRKFEREFYKIINTIPNATKLTESGHYDLGIDAKTLSGLNHELDGTVTDGNAIYIFELKHYFSGEISKDMILIFNQKIWDFAFYWLQKIQLIGFHPIFMTQSQRLRDDLRAFCFLWGITLVDRDLYPAVVLRKILDQLESEKGLSISIQYQTELDYLLQNQKSSIDNIISVWNPGTITLSFGDEPYEKALELVKIQRRLNSIIRKKMQEAT